MEEHCTSVYGQPGIIWLCKNCKDGIADVGSCIMHLLKGEKKKSKLGIQGNRNPSGGA